MSKHQKYTWIHPTLFEERLDVDYYEPEVINSLNKIVSQQYGSVTLSALVLKKQSEPQTVSSMFKEQKNNEYKYPVLTMKNLKDFYIDLNNVSYLNDKDFKKLEGFELEAGMIIYGLTGVSLGQASVVPDNIPKCITNRRIAQLSINENKANPYYITTFLNTEYGRKQFYRYSTGVAQPNLRLEDSVGIIVPFPPLKVQDYIGNKVRIAEKLCEEANRLKNDIERLFFNYTSLEGINNITEESRKEYGRFVEPRNIVNLLGAEVYRSDYVENQMEIRSLNSYVNFDDCYEYIVNGVDSRNYTNEHGTAYYKVAAIDMYGIKDKSVDFIDMSIDSINTKQKIEEGDLLITRKGSFGISMGVQARDTVGIISSEVFKVRLKNGWDADYLAYFLNSNYGKKQFLQFATGSTMKGISQQNIVEILIPKIEYYKQQEIGSLVRSIKDMYYQSRELIQQAKNDVESLIEGTFDESMVKKTE